MDSSSPGLEGDRQDPTTWWHLNMSGQGRDVTPTGPTLGCQQPCCCSTTELRSPRRNALFFDAHQSMCAPQAATSC